MTLSNTWQTIAMAWFQMRPTVYYVQSRSKVPHSPNCGGRGSNAGAHETTEWHFLPSLCLVTCCHSLCNSVMHRKWTPSTRRQPVRRRELLSNWTAWLCSWFAGMELETNSRSVMKHSLSRMSCGLWIHVWPCIYHHCTLTLSLSIYGEHYSPMPRTALLCIGTQLLYSTQTQHNST